VLLKPINAVGLLMRRQHGAWLWKVHGSGVSLGEFTIHGQQEGCGGSDIARDEMGAAAASFLALRAAFGFSNSVQNKPQRKRRRAECSLSPNLLGGKLHQRWSSGDQEQPETTNEF